MAVSIGFVMDPLESIKIAKDSTFAMMREVCSRNYGCWVLYPQEISAKDGKVFAKMRRISIETTSPLWYQVEEEVFQPLSALQVLLMRKDPPFDMNYIYTTYLLELAEKDGVLVLNKPQSLRDANEKFFTLWFPSCCPPSLISKDPKQILEFLDEYPQTIVKPPDGMGGRSIFFLRKEDPNRNVILETLTDNGTQFVVAQKYIPEISKGDKRILLIDGEVVPYVLARIPPSNDFRGNMAVGGKAVGEKISERDLWICNQVAPVLKEKGLFFVGIDVIGDYLTEINVTSPTGIQELDKAFQLNIAGTLLDAIEKRLLPHTK